MPETPEAKSGRMTLNVAKLIKILGESLYPDSSVAVRELIQNANDSCVRRLSEDAAHPPGAIHVRFDPYKRILTVQDNGSGMTWEEAQEFLTVIGNSRTEQVRDYLVSIDRLDIADRLIGKFGLGLLSAFIIGDSVHFLTRSYKPESLAVSWECDVDGNYAMQYSADEHPVGTTVTVHVNARDIGLLNSERLEELIRLYGDLLQVPIYLDPKEEAVNVMIAPWDKPDSTDADYRGFLQQRFPFDSILEIIPIQIAEEDGALRLRGALFIPRQSYLIVHEHGDVVLYVRRMLVNRTERELLPNWARFVRGVIDTPSLNEMTSRGGVRRDEMFERAQKRLGELILHHLQTIAVGDPRRLKEIVTSHNVVIKAWSIVCNELFVCIKDLVLFQTDEGPMNLARYFERSKTAEPDLVPEGGKRFIFYFTTPGGPGPHSILFSARGLHVIDASRFPDEAFLRKYASETPDVEARPLDVAGGFVFEEVTGKKASWVELEDAYEEEHIVAKAVQFQPADIPAVLIFPETAPVTEQVDALLKDAGLSETIKDLIRRVYDERERSRQERIKGSGTLYLNVRNPIIKSLAELDPNDPEIREVMFAIYHNSLMLSSQGNRTALAASSARKIFEANNRTVSNLMSKIRELRDLKSQARAQTRPATVAEAAAAAPKTGAPGQTGMSPHVTCFVAIPFAKGYEVVVEALRDVLEVEPYHWQVARADQKHFKRRISQNVGEWIARAHCYVADISELNGNVMMELGHAYWGFQNRPLLILQRKECEPNVIDLADERRLYYPWNDPPRREDIAAALRKQIQDDPELQNLRTAEAPRFLSTRVLDGVGAADRVINAIAERFTTIESFLEADPVKVASEVKGGPGTVRDLQESLRQRLKLGA